jgi:hypothetical protein
MKQIREENIIKDKKIQEKTRDREEGSRELTNASDQLGRTRKPQNIIKPCLPIPLVLLERVEPPGPTVKDGPRGVGDGQTLRGVGSTEGGEEVLQVGLTRVGKGRQGGVWGGHCSRCCNCMIRKYIGCRLVRVIGIWDGGASRSFDDKVICLLNRGKLDV